MSEKPPYYRVSRGRAYFELGKDRAGRVGMASCYPLGPDGPRARASAWSYYAHWRDLEGRAIPGAAPQNQYPPGSLGDWFAAYRKSAQWSAKAAATRTEWEDTWRLHIAPDLGMRPLRAISPADFERFAAAIEAANGRPARWRAVKIARALFNAAIKYRVLDVSPAMTVTNDAPPPRKAIWLAHEIADLMRAADAIGRPAMRLAIWIAWETMLSPVDVRRLSLAQRRKDRSGSWFETERAKTRRPVQCAISDDLSGEIDRYAAALPYAVPNGAPLIRTRTGHEYKKARLIDDFRLTRLKAFGEGETRRFQDIRRSANVEAELGGASAEDRATILANNLDRDPTLEETYTPSTVAKSRKLMLARAAGRALLEGERRNASRIAGLKVGTD